MLFSVLDIVLDIRSDYCDAVLSYKGLKQLEYLNLNFCKQLTGNICNYIRHCHHLEVLQLSGLDKLTDESIEMLLGDPLDHLTELDISHTSITDRSLEVITKGKYHLCLHVIEGRNCKFNLK